MLKVITNHRPKVAFLTTCYHLPVSEFLVPISPSKGYLSLRIQFISTTSQVTVETTKPRQEDVSRNSKSRPPLNKGFTDFLSSALRVNQAGELAATLIYKAQKAPLVNAHPHLRPLIKHMYDQEYGHFQVFNKLLTKHRVRPTAMYPLWKLAASVLGWGTAVMGRETAMACTEAIETEIGTHYNSQLRELLNMAEKLKDQGEDLGPDLQNLVNTIRRIRDEELEHLDHAVQNDAQHAVPHDLLTGIIRLGCRGAIWMSERV